MISLFLVVFCQLGVHPIQSFDAHYLFLQYLPLTPHTTFCSDTYEMNQWMKGTERLFVGEKSHVRLVGDVNVSPEKVEFRFDEDLMFRIPFRPVVSLTGRVEMKRDAQTGLITSYQEFWDQDIATVLKSAKF